MKCLLVFKSLILKQTLLLLSLPFFSLGCASSKQNGNSNSSGNNPIPQDTSNPIYYDPSIICEYGVPNYDTSLEQSLYGVIRVVLPINEETPPHSEEEIRPETE